LTSVGNAQKALQKIKYHLLRVRMGQKKIDCTNSVILRCLDRPNQYLVQR